MTNYERGFLVKCAQHGVDGRPLLKRVMCLRKQAQEADQSAGIGSYVTNQDEPEDGSYAAALVNNHKRIPFWSRKDIELPDFEVGYDTDLVTNHGLDNIRRNQATWNSAKFFPLQTAHFEKIMENLINAGKENHANYLETGTVPARDKADTTGLGKMQLSPAQLELLRQMQNSMARKGRSQDASGVA